MTFGDHISELYVELLKNKAHITATFSKDGFVMIRITTTKYMCSETFNIILKPQPCTDTKKYDRFRDIVESDFPYKYCSCHDESFDEYSFCDDDDGFDNYYDDDFIEKYRDFVTHGHKSK